MNWDPSMLQATDLALWRVVLSWSIALPLVFSFFLFYVISAEVAMTWTETTMRDGVEKAGPVKKFFLEVFVAPMLAITFLVLLWFFLIGAVSQRRST